MTVPDGDAVETAAQAITDGIAARSRNSSVGEMLGLAPYDYARWVIQALVDGGHYVPRSEHRAALDHLGIVANDLRREQDKVQARRAERDAAITRAETAEAALLLLNADRANLETALAEAVELLRRWVYVTEPATSPPLHISGHTQTFLARQAVTREERA